MPLVVWCKQFKGYLAARWEVRVAVVGRRQAGRLAPTEAAERSTR